MGAVSILGIFSLKLRKKKKTLVRASEWGWNYGMPKRKKIQEWFKVWRQCIKMHQNIKYCPKCQLILQDFFNKYQDCVKTTNLVPILKPKLKIVIQGSIDYNKNFYKLFSMLSEKLISQSICKEPLRKY